MRTTALLVFLLVASGVAGATTGPRVAIHATSPLVVSGSGFEKSARTRVTVSYGSTAQKYAKTVVTSSTGSFTARWKLMVGACTEVSVFAASAHRHAAATRRPAQDCGPPLAP